MTDIIAVVSAGSMGAAIGARLHENGVRVITPLAGRSPETLARAKAAHMEGVEAAELPRADCILSIVAPDHALGVASQVSELCRAAGRAPAYVDCNAISPQLSNTIGEVVKHCAAPYVDGGIIGGPPRPGSPSPTLYLSGPVGALAGTLARGGLRIETLEGGVGAASALKMSYAGISKGLTALGACMILAAERAGVGDALRKELAQSQAPVLGQLQRAVPDMLPKARRWEPEMREIETFIAEERLGGAIYRGVAEVYGELAADVGGANRLAAALRRFLEAEDP